MPLNEIQEQAVAHKDGPMMVLAGPGSGKTTVITHRIRHLTEVHKVRPNDILVITFTRAAAREMKERYEKLIGGKTAVSFGTFHSVFYTILKHAYNYSAENIAASEVQDRFVKEMIAEFQIETEDEREFIGSILSEISKVKSEQINLNYYYSSNCPDEIFRKLYNGYESRMRNAGLVDFDDMMVMTFELFRERKDILRAWQQKFKYILIDEFQDINRIQYEIVKLLALPENNLFIVGDDDQSIYRFRGAKPEIMLGFEKDYPDCRRLLLDINYRSTKQIVETALRLIEHNTKRFAKDIKALPKEGREVTTRIFENSLDESRMIAEKIRLLCEHGEAPSDIAVLYRTNSVPRFLMEKLMEYNVPFKTRDKVPNLYDHWISQDIITYIKLAMGSRDRAHLLRIINRPKRYVARDAMMDKTFAWDELLNYYSDKDWIQSRIEDLRIDLGYIARMKPLAAIRYIRANIGYDGYLAEYAEFRRMKVEELLEVAEELTMNAEGYDDFESWFQHIEDYSRELVEKLKETDSRSNAVTLSTMHSAKGLEYKIVYIIEANEGVTPHSKSQLPDDIEEERRLFYVAMTRAKEQLYVYAVKERFRKKVELSRFIPEYVKLPKRDGSGADAYFGKDNSLNETHAIGGSSEHSGSSGSTARKAGLMFPKNPGGRPVDKYKFKKKQ